MMQRRKVIPTIEQNWNSLKDGGDDQGGGQPTKISYSFDTNMKNSNYDDDAEEEGNSNRCIYSKWTKMKNLWRMVVMIRGEGCQQKYLI